MARLATSGFEWQVIDTAIGRAEGPNFQIIGSPTIDTSVQRSGDACLKCTTAGQFSAWQALPGQLDHWIYIRAYIRVDGNPTTSGAIVNSLNTAAAGTGHIFLLNQGSGTPPKLRLRQGNNTVIGSDSSALTVNQWYCAELGVFVPTAGNGKLYFWLDGVLVASSDSANTGNTLINSVRFGTVQTPGNSVSVYYDDVAINDDTGAAQNSRPGEGRVVLLKPTADSARVGVTGGAGGTTNLFNAVDNIPPVGVASGSATDSSQIKAPTTGDYYEATLQPYTDRLAATDLVTLIRPVAAVGPDSTSGGSSALSTTANPADATETSNAVGAVAVSTYPVGWAAVRGPVLYSPTVTLGTSPKVKLRRDGGVSVLHSCLIGLYVEYQRRLTASLSDSVTPSEDVGKAPHPNVADSATPTDLRTAAAGKASADSVTASDATSLASGKKLADTATSSDASALTPGKGLTDSVTTTDTRVADADTVLADTASVSDALTTAEGNFVTLGDSVTVTDADTEMSGHQLSQSASDSVSVSDSVVLMASAPSGTQPSTGGAVMVPVIRRVTVESHRLHFNDPVFLTDDLETDRRLSDLQRDEELALALA